MKITKKQAKTMLNGWDYVKEHNKKTGQDITKEEFIDAFEETIKERKEFCAKCDLCNKCD
jgi:peptidoglycan hydrolase CwlO-like protein